MTDRASSEGHPDTRGYHAVHNTFRLATTRYVDATGKLEPSALHPIIGSRWEFYAGVLHHHHHTEDDSVFPALLTLRPDLQPLVDKLEDDHRRLVPVMDAVGVAVAAFEDQPDAGHQKTVHDAIASVRDLFFPHLDIEDEQILPALAESMPPKEYDRLDQQALRSIPRPYLPNAVGALDEVIRGLPEEQRPPPPPLPIRLMLAVSWRRKWTEWIKPLLVS
jgi:hemerythrin-like domain-containing protein